ncbi:AI-2E family transporter [Pasteurella multocida]|uniref:AI-2E family transporter n=1 Tax=Pasteurella multocida TaxID=747 RepID=UPI000E300EC8|nr:AI-2E family transporter [Pasteurella multocida]AXN95829.1 AI-2E family transporter [Pasteurella multocida]AXN99632.1 AI-2E family transporter [Pasteurella multocida]AXO01841.1 AI-2E family transporter [Pasteurella multocida]AXO04062.1 AI-2E family transporter [Pasteurella multocida]QDA24635.1 AI-2E family transporter [Pasteurella multocida]
MIEMLKNWYNNRFSDPQAMGLFAILLFGFISIYFFSHLIAPLLIAIVLAYLLEWPIRVLTEKLKFPRLLSTAIIFGGFLGLILVIVLVFIPTLWTQTLNLVTDLPRMFNKLNEWLLSLPEHYPELVDYQTIDSVLSTVRSKILGFGESALKFSLTSLLSLVTLGIYAFLVPLMVFFLLKDKTELIASVSRFLPCNRTLASSVWKEMQQQIANYIRGKLFEIIIVTAVTYAIFVFFNLNYSLLLAVAVGLSVLVPYIGAVLVTIPIALVAVAQFGITPTFWYIITAYVISQILDGNLLVPFLFSEAVNLHPLTIIIAVLIFGGLWGFWGVFFAIPLATLVKAVVNAWPSTEQDTR